MATQLESTPDTNAILSVPADPQGDSPLFNRLPAELRNEIFALALADHQDQAPETRYSADTCYTRPHYFAPRKTDVRLLRTCRAVYAEAWFLPFLLREQTHWLTSCDRAPPEYRAMTGRPAVLAATVDRVARHLGVEAVETDALRVFAQMWALEENYLGRLLRAAPRLHPRRLTLTIRHTDWWWWESDEPLRFEAGWIRAASDFLPPSVRELRVELESVRRKKDQVDEIGRKMAERWMFRRMDGVVLVADASGAGNEVERWTGSSTWGGKTWKRDETRPGEIEYYVLTVAFRPRSVVERRGGKVADRVVSALKAGGSDFRRQDLWFVCGVNMRLNIEPKEEEEEEEEDDEEEEEDDGDEEEEDDDDEYEYYEEEDEDSD